MGKVIKKVFVDQLPSEYLQNLPTPYVFYMGFYAYASMLGIFIFIFYLSFLSANTLRFLSVTNNEKYCDSVHKSITQNFLFDDSGEWEGTLDFKYASAVYSMTLQNFSGSSEDFFNLATSGFVYINKYSSLAKSQNLAMNLIMWTTFQGIAEYGGNEHIIRIEGSTKTLFNRKYLVSSISNKHGTCLLPSDSTFDRSNAVLTIQYSYSQFMLPSSQCSSILNPSHVGYDADINGDYFRIKIDINTYATALSVNNRLIHAEDLQLIPRSTFDQDFDGSTIQLSLYNYDRFPNMDPLTCYNGTTQDSAIFLCSLNIGNNMQGFPVFNHMGSNSTTPSYCDCNSTLGTSDACNAFDLIAGLILFEYEDAETYSKNIDEFLRFTLTYDYSKDINKEAYNASFNTVNVKHSRSDRNQNWDASVFDFCNLSNTTRCTLIATRLFDDTQTITDYYYPLEHGSCNDSFILPFATQFKIVTNPPVQLDEIYYECRNSNYEAFNSALGISMGNMTIYIPILLMVLIFFFRLFISWKKLSILETYSKEDINEVLNFVGFNLLLARDKRYKRSQTQSQGSTLNKSDDVERHSASAVSASKQNAYEGSDDSVVSRLFEELSAAGAAIPRFNGRESDDVSQNTDGGCDDDGVELNNANNSGGGRDSTSSYKRDVSRRLRLNSSLDYVPNPLYKK